LLYCDLYNKEENSQCTSKDFQIFFRGGSRGWYCCSVLCFLQDSAASSFLVLLGLVQTDVDGAVKDCLESFLGERRALVVLGGADLLGESQSLILLDHLEALGCQLRDHAGVSSKIALGSDENQRSSRAVVLNFRIPLALDVLERRGGDDREADQEDVSLGIGQRSQSVIIFLSSSIPQSQVDWLSIDHDVGRIVIENCGDILVRESVRGIADQQAGLSDGSITNNDALEVLHDSLD